MAGAGTDKTKRWAEVAGPIIVLVEPQLGENIGAAARVMANFGLSRLRLVKPRDGWPNIHARRSASGADRVLDESALYETVKAAIADCALVLATTFRELAPPGETGAAKSASNTTHLPRSIADTPR